MLLLIAGRKRAGKGSSAKLLVDTAILGFLLLGAGVFVLGTLAFMYW